MASISGTDTLSTLVPVRLHQTTERGDDIHDQALDVCWLAGHGMVIGAGEMRAGPQCHLNACHL